MTELSTESSPLNISCSGLLSEEEKGLLQRGEKAAEAPYWKPLIWAGWLFDTARKENRISTDVTLGLLEQDLESLRKECKRTVEAVIIGVPVAYSQVSLL